MRLAVLCLILIVMSSCEEEIPIVLPEQEEQLGAYVFIDQTADTAAVVIERTLRFEETLTENDAKLQGMARVDLFEEGSLIVNFKQRDFSIFYEAQDTLGIEEGKTYSIEIEHPQFETMIASEQAIVNPVKPSVAKIENYTLPDGLIRDFVVVFDINDPEGESNFYSVGAFASQKGSTEVSTINPNEIILVVDGVAQSDFEFISLGDDIYFGDESFNGKNVQILIPDFAFFLEPDQVVFFNISESYYNFMRFLDNDLDVDYGAFLETIPVYSNFENGFGVFAFFTEEVIDLQE
ncbi:MAG: DUF4249 domain-containing protein [Saprospiraceae bacterium]|nr:DUF4249 domain-containing protein [Saprospiraceae bacterium]